MKNRICSSAHQNLIDGHRFYAAQGEGVGEYFLGSLYPDIDSLAVTAGIHDSRSRFITAWKAMPL